ncbi:hypothetical protein BC332_15529 [Capsicum chinense]|nr:hypothetical protein BC332_15529 [Capsicum chinense]
MRHIDSIDAIANVSRHDHVDSLKLDAVNINMEELTVTADGGVGFRKLIDMIEKSRLSLVEATHYEVLEQLPE